MKNHLSPGAYAFMFARTAFFDHIVEQALKDNLAQVVFLGAGYDSRPYRFSVLIQDTRIFELDAPPTQRRKQECLRQAGVAIPAHVRFVPINFETESLQEVLLAAGFQQGSQTLFLWEGVSYYLSRETVDSLLAAVRAISPAGSFISFDYASISVETLGDQNVQEFRKSMRSKYANEPAKFGIPSGQIEAFLNERGFQVVEHLTAAEMNAKYLPNTADPDRGQVLPLFCFVYAKSIETVG